MSEPAPPRDALPIALAWSLLPLAELGLAWGAMVRPAPTQIVFELLGCAVLGVAQWRLAKRPWMRSPLWPGLLVLASTALTVGPDGALSKLLYAVGIAAVVATVVRGLRGRRVGAVAAVLSTLVGAVGARYLVLSHAAALEAGHLQGAVAVSDAPARLAADLAGPLAALRRSPAGDGPPLVLITIDTLRHDDAVQMQSFRRVGARGALFERAMSTSSWTLPAMASVHTGGMPSLHGADARPGGHYQGIAPTVPTLAEQLQGAGYATAAFVTNPWLESGLGFARGFDPYLHANEAFPNRLMLAGMPQGPLPIEAEAVVDRALGWLDGAPDRGWFLWVHLLDPHMPYLNADPDSVAATLRDQDLRAGRMTSSEDRAAIRAAYRGEVAYTDTHVGRLLDALEARGVLDAGVVVLTADHGEEFWDHGGAEHGHSHHTEVNDVALAVGGAGVSGRTGGVASLVDIAPTLLAAAGLESGGVDLRAGVPLDRIATAYGNNYYRIDRSARTAQGKVMVRGEPRVGPPAIGFDLRRDPDEHQPLAPESSLLRAALAIEAPSAGDAAAVNMEALRALGYVE